MDEQLRRARGEAVLDALATALAEKLATAENAQTFVSNVVNDYTKPPAEPRNDDFFYSIIKPALSSLIRLKDDTAKELRQFNEYVKENACKSEATVYAEEIMLSLVEGIDDILLDYDVQSFSSVSESFNPLRHQAVKKIITDDPALAKTVAKTLSAGYERKGFIVGKERVTVYALS